MKIIDQIDNEQDSCCPHSISWYHFQVTSELQKHISAGLVRIDTYSVHRQNGSGFLIYSELNSNGDTSSHTYLMTAEKGASSGTETTLKGCSISDVSMILKVTLFPLLIIQLLFIIIRGLKMLSFTITIYYLYRPTKMELLIKILPKRTRFFQKAFFGCLCYSFALFRLKQFCPKEQDFKTLTLLVDQIRSQPHIQPIQYLLMLLIQAQIKEQELKLFQVNGFSLAECSDFNSNSKIFKDLSTQTSIKQLERLKIIKLQSSGLSSNANLKAIVNVLLKTIYDNETKQDLLDFVKSSLYSQKIDLTQIKLHPLQLSNGQMKKLIVQFFYSLSYSRLQDKVDSKLAKYPIIMEIMVLYIRIILKQLGLNNAENYLFRLPTEEVFTLIIQYFDLNCREQGNLYIFFEDRMFILEDEHNQILLGQYIQNQNQKKPQRQDYRFKEIQEMEDLEYNAENEWSKQGTEGFNRSLQLRGMVSESIMFQQEAATPFFIFDQDSCTSFQSSREPSLVGDQENQKVSLIKNQKDISLLKQMDRMTGSQQMGLGGNLGMKKTTKDNQFKARHTPKEEPEFNYGYGFGMTLESPITLDSPHTLEIPSDRNFGLQIQHSQKIKQMKKSKSEKRSKTLPAENHVDDDLQKYQVASFSEKNLEVQSNISQNMLMPQKETCYCFETKKQKLKLSSRLYEINMTYNHKFPDFTKKNKFVYQIPSTTSIFAKPNLVFTRIKSISGFQKQIKEKFKLDNEALRLQQSGRIMPTACNDQSFSSYSVRAMPNPESDTHSRRQFSPLSNIDRPLSPFGGSKSITNVPSPKITFNYKNPLKYSTCIKKVPEKSQQKR